jgi:valyl-tRNA synthetase
MVRHLALFNETPYKSCLINGMVLGVDGRKMSKSLKNYVATPEVLDKYGADAARQWAAAGGATGSDIPFRWPDVEYGWRFLIKLWNASRFVGDLLKDYEPNNDSKRALQALDKWILSKTERLTERVTEAFENCQFNTAMEEIRNFTWHVFCDCYIEAAKDRLYKRILRRRKAQGSSIHALHSSTPDSAASGSDNAAHDRRNLSNNVCRQEGVQKHTPVSVADRGREAIR